MSEFLVLGGGVAMYQPDALHSFSGSAESGVTVEAATKQVQPPDLASGLPASESVFRTLHIKVVHNAGCGFYVTPVLDGVELSENTAYLSRPAPAGGAEETHTFRVPLGKAFETVAVGQRGTSMEVKITMTDPAGILHLEWFIVGYRPIKSLRGRRTTE